MIRRALGQAWGYKLSQWFWYRSGRQQEYLSTWIRPRAGDRILDIGCGPAILLHWMPAVDYIGYDPNPHYIDNAKARFGDRGKFTCGYLTRLPPSYVGSFDLVLASGVLHHMSDAQAEEMLALAAKALKPGGRLVTRDGCFEQDQSAFVKFLLRSDRGHFVRTRQGYESLFHSHFDLSRVDIRRDMLRLPYSLIHCEAVMRVS